MTNTVTNAFVQQFDTTIRMLAQQKESRFDGLVIDRGTIEGESFTANHLADIEDTPEKLVRHGDTVWSEADHITRVALMKDFFQAVPVDRDDEPKVLANPSGIYADSLNSAWNRRKDAIIYAALRGNSQAKDGSSVVLPASQKIAHGSAGFTLEKIIQAKKLFRANECDEHSGEELYMAYDPNAMEDILSDAYLTSIDRLAVKMLQDGEVGHKWMGFYWIPYNAIYSSGGVYYTVAWAKSAVHKGTGFVEGKADRRADKMDALQVSLSASFGATRVHELGVVEIAYQ